MSTDNNGPVNLPQVDFHIHTRYSADVVIMYKGYHTAVDVAYQARQQGLEAFGITDHCDYVGVGFTRRQDRVIEEARQRNGVDVLSGAGAGIGTGAPAGA